MGRSGGSGGRSSGGSFGGSRSSGGRSGGFGSSHRGGSGSGFGGFGSSGGGFFGSGGSSGSGGGFFGSGPGMGSGGNYGGNGGGRGPSGCGCGAVILFIAVILIIVIMMGFFADSGSTELTKSTIAREPLPQGSVNETGYYIDEVGWINNQTEMQDGLKYFYQQTGVQPYVVITDTINGSHNPTASQLDAYANQLYEELFTDEAHLLFVFFEYDEAYMDRYVAGTQAKTVIDTEAADILLDYIDRNYYDSSLTDEQFFSNSFRDAADRIMTVTKSPWISALTIIAIVFGVVIVTALLFVWWRRAKNQQNLEAKQTADMLNTPLEKFDDKEIEDLAKKYEDNPPQQQDENKP